MLHLYNNRQAAQPETDIDVAARIMEKLCSKLLDGLTSSSIKPDEMRPALVKLNSSQVDTEFLNNIRERDCIAIAFRSITY